MLALSSCLLATYLPFLSLERSSGVAYAADASLCDTNFYASNDINWFNECASACSATSSGDTAYTNSSENTEAIFKYLTSTTFKPLKGPMNAVQASAFLGNMYQESKYDPAAIQSGKKYNEKDAKDASVGAYAFGLIQWDTGRRVALIKYAEKHKASGVALEDAWKDITIQLGYLKEEVEGSEKAILTDNDFKNSQSEADIEKATVRVRAVYERAGAPHDTNRVKAAKEMYAKYKDIAPTLTSSPSGTTCGSYGGAGNGDIAETAKSLSWDQRAEEGAKDHKALENKPEYTQALKETGVNKLGDSCSKGGNSCDAFIATVLRYSGVDPNFYCCRANSQHDYLEKHTELYAKVSDKPITSTKELEPGDILWTSGHVKIYIGDGREAAASHCNRTGEQSKLYLSDGPYYAYRAKR